MAQKLTLSVDGRLIARAKRVARQRGVSVSELVSEQFAKLEEGDARDPFFEQLHADLKKKTQDADEHALREQHIREKYL